MNILPLDRQVEIISALTEGCSIRSVERLTGVHRDTIMRLGIRVGEGCAALHDQLMRNLTVGRIELDEIWSYVAKKQRIAGGNQNIGGQYTFLALAGAAKAIISYRIGKRTTYNTRAFLTDVRERVIGAPEISADGFHAYPDAVDLAFGSECQFGVMEKHYAVEHVKEAARRYSPAKVVSVSRRTVAGDPGYVSTAYVERQNLTLRMQQRRFTRLTNAFSKKLENHMAAVALYVAHYNLCRVHEAVRVTPAMAVGAVDHIWSVGELVQAALAVDPIPPQFPRFTVIQGGRLDGRIDRRY